MKLRPPGTGCDLAFSFDLQRFSWDNLSITEVTTEEGKSVFSATKDGVTKYGTANDFTTDNLSGATEITLLDSFTMPAGTKENNYGTITIPADQSVTLDLNGKILTKTSEGTAFLIEDGNHTFEIIDSATGGKIVHTADIVGDKTDATAIKDAQKAARYSAQSVISVGSSKDSNANGATFTMTGGSIESNTTCVYGANKSNITISGNSTLQSYMSTCVFLGNDGHKNDDKSWDVAGGQNLTVTGNAHLITGVAFTDKTTESIIENGVAITRKKNSNLPAIQVTGNYNNEEATNSRNTHVIDETLLKVNVTVSGDAVLEFNNNEDDLLTKDNGEYLGSPTAVYIGGYSKLIIADNAKITSNGTGVEMRAGELEVTGGTVKSNATKYTAHSKSGGSSTFGAAIAIAQHTTKQAIGVNISNGNISGPNALAISNPEGNKGNESGKVSATIDGGTFEGKASSTSTTSTDSGNAIVADSANIVITVNEGTLSGDVIVNKIKGNKNDIQDSTIVLAGGTTTGKVQVVTTSKNATTGEEEETEQEGDNSLKVMGTAKVTNVESAKKYVSAGYTISDDGTAEESPENGWKGRTTPSTTYDFVLVGSPSQSLVTAQDVSNQELLKYDKTNRLLAIPNVEYSLDSTDSVLAGSVENLTKKGYYLTKYTTVTGAVTVSPVTSGVRINGTGFIDDTIITLTADGGAHSLGIAVDATNNNLANIKGGTGKDSIKAGLKATTLDGGANDDTLDGGNGKDTFVYSAGKDEIKNYVHGTDVASLSGDLTHPNDFSKVSFDSNNLVFTFNENDVLTFKSAANVSLTKNGSVYSYKGHNGGGVDYIAQGDVGISLGTAHDSIFNGTVEANENYETIDASKVNIAIKVTGNDKGNYIVAGTNGSTLDGGYGDDLLKGGNGADTFVYSAGTDNIQDYDTGDLVTLRGFKPADAIFTADKSNISLDFGGSDKLIFAGGASFASGISLQSGQNIYTYTKDYVALNGKSVTLAASFAGTSFAAGDYYTVDASAVTDAVSIAGNANNNLIIGSASATLYGGAGKDKLNVNERNNDAKFTFQYTAGKDIVLGFDANNDKLDIDEEQIGKITDANSSNGKLAFTFGNKSDVLTFKSDGDINAISLQSDSGNAYLTKDGYVAGEAFSLFGSAKGKIDLTEDPYQAASITSVDATEVKKQSVTLTGGSQGGTFTFAENRKKDLFEYGGGSVTISGYEAGKDKINLGDFSIDGFKVDGNNVSLNVDGNTMSIAGAAKSEILIRQATGKSNSYSKMVFYQDGVLLNKGKRPTIATVSGGASSYQAENTIKKIYVTGGVSGIAVHAGNNKTTLDASDAGGVSLYGGAKSDKLIGSESGTDYFFYSAGKDVIENYAANEEISLTDSGLDLDDAKITVSKKSLKFKFSGSKNALTIKSNDTINSAIVDGETYTFSKNAIGKDKNVSLTSQFSGTYKISKDDAGKIEVVYGNAVKKNLTFKGSEEAETFTGGTKKTTFKGGGGADSLVGGSGKDIFFYAKGDKGSATIASFDFTKDKIKIANGTIGEISTVSGGIQFDMTSGKKGDTSNVGSFTLASSIGGGGTGTATPIDTSKVFIKANNNYYWFAQNADSDYGVSVGDLITADRKVSKSNATATGFAIIDLGYSTNLTKSGVATKAGDFTFTQGSITKKTTET